MVLDLHKKMHPFFIQPWHRGILGTKVHVINIFSNYHSGSLEESWQRRMIQHQPRDLPRALEDHPLNKALKKKLMFFCSHSWILNTHHCQNPHFLRRVKSESLESWTPHPRKRIGHESISQIRAAMENPGPTWNFPSWKKARKICPCCFFNTLSPYVKILTVFCSPRGWVPPSSSSIPWSISPTYGTVLQLTYSHHKANGIYMYYYTRSLPILIFKLSPLLEEDLNMRKMYKVILAYSPGAMQHNGLHIWELWDGDQKHRMNNWRRGRKTRQSYPIILLYKHYASTMLKRGRSLAIRNASDFFGCIINKPSSKIYILAPKYLTWMTRGLGLVSPFHNQCQVNLQQQQPYPFSSPTTPLQQGPPGPGWGPHLKIRNKRTKRTARMKPGGPHRIPGRLPIFWGFVPGECFWDVNLHGIDGTGNNLLYLKTFFVNSPKQTYHTWIVSVYN